MRISEITGMTMPEIRFFRLGRWKGKKCLMSYLMDDLVPLKRNMTYRTAWEWAQSHAILNPGLPYIAFELDADERIWCIPSRSGRDQSDFVQKVWGTGYQVVRGGTLYVLPRKPIQERCV